MSSSLEYRKNKKSLLDQISLKRKHTDRLIDESISKGLNDVRNGGLTKIRRENERLSTILERTEIEQPAIFDYNDGSHD